MAADEINLPRSEALDILAALDTAATLASTTGDLTAELDIVEAHATLTLRLYGHLNDEDDH